MASIRFGHLAPLSFIYGGIPLHQSNRDMSGDFELDAEFNAIMTASRSRPALHHPMNKPADGGFGPSRVHPSSERVPQKTRIQAVCLPPTSYLPCVINWKRTKNYDEPGLVHRSNERVSLQPDIQAVCLPLTSYTLRIVNRQNTKKYYTIVKGFKVLEASYEESERKLAATEERLSAADTAYSTLTAEMEIGRQVLRDRDTVR